MATLIKKIKKGKAYWYAVECRRVNGQPRIVKQTYLGRAEDILAATQAATAPAPREVWLRQFGAIAALLNVAEQLDVVSIIDRHVATCVTKLEALAKRLAVWHAPREGQRPRHPAGRPPTVAAVHKQVHAILAPQHIKTVIHAEVAANENGLPTLRYASDRPALHELIDRTCGKTILFTDRGDWTNEQIVAAYRGQANIEEVFRDMNNWDFLHWMPMYHWTDQKIRVHAFYCVLALMLVGVLRKQASDAGLDLSTHALLDRLSKIYETVVVYPSAHPPAPPRLATTLSRMDATQKALYTALNLARWRT